MLVFAIGFTAYASIMSYALRHDLCARRASLMLALSLTVALVLWVKSSGWLLGAAFFAVVFAVFAAGAARIAARIWRANRPA
jgi:FlaA1/EpsC-like NDP-sugar epimerase